jgi:hypothetical protein
MTPYSLELPQRRFGETYCLHLQSSRVSLTRKQAYRNKHWTGLSVCLVNCWWPSPAHSFLVESPARLTTTNLGVVYLTLVNVEITLYRCTREVFLSNLDRDIRYSGWDCSWYSLVPPDKPLNSTYIGTSPLPFKSFPIHHSCACERLILYNLGTHSVIKITLKKET